MAAGMAVIGVVTGNAHVLPNALLGSPGSKAKRSPQSIVHLEPGTSDGQRGSVGSADSMLVDEESAQVLARANNIPSPAVRSIGLLERSLAHSARAMSCLAADGEPHPVIAALPQHSPDSPATALLVSDETADWEAGQRQGQRQGHRHWPGYRAGIGCAVFIGISNGSFLVKHPIHQSSRGRPHVEGVGKRITCSRAVAITPVTACPRSMLELEIMRQIYPVQSKNSTIGLRQTRRNYFLAHSAFIVVLHRKRIYVGVTLS